MAPSTIRAAASVNVNAAWARRHGFQNTRRMRESKQPNGPPSRSPLTPPSSSPSSRSPTHPFRHSERGAGEIAVGGATLRRWSRLSTISFHRPRSHLVGMPSRPRVAMSRVGHMPSAPRDFGPPPSRRQAHKASSRTCLHSVHYIRMHRGDRKGIPVGTSPGHARPAHGLPLVRHASSLPLPHLTCPPHPVPNP